MTGAWYQAPPAWASARRKPIVWVLPRCHLFRMREERYNFVACSATSSFF
jgi:hypothetical protein